MKSILSSVLLLVVSVPAVAETLRVPADHATIQAAVDAAQAGDTVQVSKGSYAPFVVDMRSGLTVKGQGKPSVDGGGAMAAVVTISESTDITLDGLTIENSGDRGILITDSTNVTIQRSLIQGIASDAIRAWGSMGLLIEKNRIEDTGEGVDFSDESPAGPTRQSSVLKNRFERTNDGVDAAGDGHVIEKNRFEDLDGTAVLLDPNTVDVVISKNKIENPNTAIRLLGRGHVVEKNNVKGTRNEGIIVEAENCRVEKNKLDRVDDDAIDLEGDNNQILSNKIKNTGDNGIEMGPASGDPFPVTGNVVEKNKIKGSGGGGVFIADTVSGNELLGNKASKSDGFDLDSQAAEAANTFDGNKFGTTQFP